MRARRGISRLQGYAVVLLATASVLLLAFLGLGPRTGAYRTFTVYSGSMQPTLPVGAVAIVVPRPLEAVRVGDILTYRIPVENHRIVTHRVIEVLEHGPRPVVRTKGDANRDPDRWTARLGGDAAWVVVGHVPLLGRLVLFLRSPAVRPLLLFGLPAAFVLLSVWSIWRPADGAGSRARAPRATPPPPPPPLPPPPARRTEPLVTVRNGAAEPAATVSGSGVPPTPRPRRTVRRAAVMGAVALTLMLGAGTPAVALLGRTASAAHTLASGVLVSPASLSGTARCSTLLLVTNHSVDLSWPNTGDSLTTAYELQFRIGTGAWNALATLARPATTHSHTGLAASTTYRYRIRAARGSWTGAWVESANITTKNNLCL